MLSMICVPFQLHNLGSVLKTEMESKTHSIKWKRLWLLFFIITIIVSVSVVVFFDTFALKRANTEEYLKNPKEIVVTTNILCFCYEQKKILSTLIYMYGAIDCRAVCMRTEQIILHCHSPPKQFVWHGNGDGGNGFSVENEQKFEN